jgi:hypothetical protein
MCNSCGKDNQGQVRAVSKSIEIIWMKLKKCWIRFGPGTDCMIDCWDFAFVPMACSLVIEIALVAGEMYDHVLSLNGGENLRGRFNRRV